MLTAPLTTADLAPVLATIDALDADATLLRECADFAAWCDERRDAWVDAVDAESAEHPRHGGRVFATLRFLVAPESAGDIEGHVRRASSDFPGLGSDTLARTADDPAAGAAIAMRLLRDAGRVDACIFRPI